MRMKQGRGIPFGIRLKDWSQRVLPLAGWLMLVAAAGWMYERRVSVIRASGVAGETVIDVAAVRGGRIRSVGVLPHDLVAAGQPVAYMENNSALATLDTAEAEAARLGSELDALVSRWRIEADDRTGDSINRFRRFASDVEDARVDLLGERARRERDRITLDLAELRLQRAASLMDTGVVGQEEIDILRSERDALARHLEESVATLAAMEDRLEESRRRVDLLAADPEYHAEPQLVPLRHAVTVQEARIQEVRIQIASTVIHAPRLGRVETVLHEAGEVVAAGEPILRLVIPQAGPIVAYLDERAAARIGPNTEVRLRPLREPGSVVLSRVDAIGPRVAQVPLRQRAVPSVPQWGVPVFVENPEAWDVRPGDGFEMEFLIRSAS